LNYTRSTIFDFRIPILDLQARASISITKPTNYAPVPETGIARNRTRRADKNPRKFAESPADRRVAAKFSLPRIIGEKSCRGDSHRLIGESRAQLAIIAPDLALISEGERVNNIESFPFHSTRAWNESLGYSPLERPIHRSKLNRRHAE